MSNTKNETIDTSNVYEMFEELKELQEKQLMATEELCSKLVSTSESAPAITPEDGTKIETLTEKLDSVGEKLDHPLRHHHIIDPIGNVGMIAWFGVVALLVGTLFVVHSQRDTIARNRDNDLKYRYIQMRGEATPSEILQLRNVFEFNRNPDSIIIIRRQVEQYERLVKEQAENAARAKLNSAEAQRLQNQAETVKGRK